MLYLLGSSFKENLRLKRVLPALLAALAIAGLGYAWPLMVGQRDSQTYTNLVDQFIFRMVALTAAIFALGIVAQEVEQRTIVYWITRPVLRWKMVLARYLAAGCTVSLFSLIALVGARLVTGKEGTHFVAGDAFAIILGSFAYCGLFLLVSLLANRAMLICLLYAFGWESAIPHLPGELYRLSVYSYMESVSHRLAELTHVTGPMSTVINEAAPQMLSKASGIISLIACAGLCLSVSLAWFSTHEYVPREDAE